MSGQRQIWRDTLSLDSMCNFLAYVPEDSEFTQRWEEREREPVQDGYWWGMGVGGSENLDPAPFYAEVGEQLKKPYKSGMTREEVRQDLSDLRDLCVWSDRITSALYIHSETLFVEAHSRFTLGAEADSDIVDYRFRGRLGSTSDPGTEAIRSALDTGDMTVLARGV